MHELTQLIKDDMRPALGVTEPGAIAYAVSKAKSYVPGELEQVTLLLNSGMYKNAYTCGIPNSHFYGNEYAAALGVVAGKPEKELESLADVTEADNMAAEQLVKDGKITVKMSKITSRIFIEACVKTTGGEAMVQIRDAHTNIVRMDTKDYTTAQLSKIAGYVFQNPDDQIFHNNVEDEIRFGPKKQGLSEEEIVKKTEWAAKLCGLSEQMQENPYNLPLSIRKFVSIASVLAMDDKILILDEPTAGQDLIGINRLENILTELKKENKTVVTITHDMEFAVNNFKKIFVMSHKNLLRVGNAKEIFSDDELLKDSMLKKTYIGDLCDRLNLNETAVTIEEFLKYFV